MVFVNVDAFLNQACRLSPLDERTARTLGASKAAGDPTARDALIQGYLPFAATFVRRAPRTVQTLHTVYACIAVVEHSVDNFDFMTVREPFARYLGKRLQQCIVRCIAER